MGNVNTQKVRYAVIGLGHIAQVAVLPGFQNAENSELTALVSGDPVKLNALGEKYKVEILCDYAEIDNLLTSDSIDAVYIATPNSLHTEYVLKALQNKIHVLCEKPLAPTATECEQMVETALEHETKLMVAYRLHFEPANLKAVEIAQSGRIGDLKMFNSIFSFEVRDEENIRLKGDLAGGSLYDIGIYCINAARYIFGDEPIEVFAFTSKDSSDPRFQEVDEMWSASLRFPNDRLATFTCSFSATAISRYDVVGTKGSLHLKNAYEYAEPMHLFLNINDKMKRRTFPKGDQFGAEISYFSDCILHDRYPEPSGMEGLADIRVIEALTQSARTGISVSIDPVKKVQYPTVAQMIQKPGIERPPEEIHTRGPSSN